MKKWLVMSLVATLSPSIVLARGSHPMAGCGLGYLLLSNKDNQKVTQVVGATTNATGMQTFGISSGTSGCTEDGAVKLARATEVFVDVNLAELRRDIAVGHGEYVQTLASLVGTSNAPALVQYLHTEYTALFPNSDTSSADMLKILSEKLSQHPELLG